jgi:predicted CXXCH cytochrome family protein
MEGIGKSIIILFLLMAAGVIVFSFSNNPPHQFKREQCGYCHLNYENPLRFRDNISTLCNYCHRRDRALSHIVGAKPSMQVPPDFHIDENGETTCATCHDVHMDRVDPVTGERTHLLRSKLRGKEFCDSCHSDTVEMVKARDIPVHAVVFESAHFGYYTGGIRSIDRVSLYCIGCHEGGLAPHAPVSLETGRPIGRPHPIGMDYMRAYRRSKELRSPRELNPEIRFFGGKVGCTSCHNPFKLERHRLHITMEESKLCFECHIK